MELQRSKDISSLLLIVNHQPLSWASCVCHGVSQRALALQTRRLRFKGALSSPKPFSWAAGGAGIWARIYFTLSHGAPCCLPHDVFKNSGHTPVHLSGDSLSYEPFSDWVMKNKEYSSKTLHRRPLDLEHLYSPDKMIVGCSLCVWVRASWKLGASWGWGGAVQPDSSNSCPPVSVSSSEDFLSPSCQPPANTATPTTQVSIWTNIHWSVPEFEISDSASPLSGRSLLAPCSPSLPLHPVIPLTLSASFRLCCLPTQPASHGFYVSLCFLNSWVSCSPFQAPMLGDPRLLRGPPNQCIGPDVSSHPLIWDGSSLLLSQMCWHVSPGTYSELFPFPEFTVTPTVYGRTFIYSSCCLRISGDPDVNSSPLSFPLQFCASPPSRCLWPTVALSS